ncbi:hypothetical protein KPH14_012352 [Odynerus spinipes]|uniref:Uncharacterized protein n=1 Tax=Odynerus spinipes TaxID=1348599 RepID=A0AAD9VMN2_9HYME|nr:hypothetical protein KPH14_012352 [Odynerus spinipes]
MRIDAVPWVLLRFLNLWKTQCFKLKKTSYDHIDVKMLREYRGYYSIQLTNCGYCEYNTCNISDLAQFVFRNFSVRKFLKNKPLAIINLKDEDVETTYDLYFPPKKRLSLIKNSHDNEKPADFPFCRKYLSIKPMHRLMASDIEKFKATVLEEITRLCEENTNVKFTYRCDGKMLHNNYVPLDEEYKLCQVLSTTLTDIVRQSLDTEFREKCFALSKAENSGQLRDSLMTRLLPIINENYIFSTK